jgi:hypothetical protein
MEMQLSKGRDGWKAETHIELDNGRHLSITTRKGNGGLRTGAQAYRIENGFMTFVLFGDYSATVATGPARCTEKTVAELHRQALAKLDEVKAAVAAFYSAKGE